MCLFIYEIVYLFVASRRAAGAGACCAGGRLG